MKSRHDMCIPDKQKTHWTHLLSSLLNKGNLQCENDLVSTSTSILQVLWKQNMHRKMLQTIQPMDDRQTATTSGSRCKIQLVGVSGPVYCHAALFSAPSSMTGDGALDLLFVFLRGASSLVYSYLSTSRQDECSPQASKPKPGSREAG